MIDRHCLQVMSRLYSAVIHEMKVAVCVPDESVVMSRMSGVSLMYDDPVQPVNQLRSVFLRHVWSETEPFRESDVLRDLSEMVESLQVNCQHRWWTVDCVHLFRSHRLPTSSTTDNFVHKKWRTGLLNIAIVHRNL